MDRELLKTADREITDEVRMQFEKGWLWEVALSRAFGEKAAVRPKPIELDGIVGSPDGVIPDIPPAQWVGDGSAVRTCEAGLIVEEYKCTAMSSRKSPADMWKWIMQVKGYCKMLGTTKCIFRVLHVRDFVPVYNPWELVFTQAELDENWQAILNQAKTMKEIDNGA